nr:NADH-quinone oxidoreductase subunit J [Nitrospiraceae bacterium]
AGAIMILFVFVIMMLNLGTQSAGMERQWMRAGMWAGPAVLALLLLADVIYMLAVSPRVSGYAAKAAGPREVGIALFGPYLIGVELASVLLLAGLVGSFHLGRSVRQRLPEEGEAGGGEGD